MKKKKIIQLGANFFQATVIRAAKELGCHVITVDYRPDNPGHKFANEYHNISTIDKNAVLKLAMDLKIDGIISYASDVSAPTAAYVAERMGLPTNPYMSVLTMTRKDLMRGFLQKYGFNVPRSESFSNYDDFYDYIKDNDKPLIIKPVDSSGSKGVIKLMNNNEIKSAWENALSFSGLKSVIVETFLHRAGYQIAGDGFIVDGKLVFMGLAQEHFDNKCNPFVPIGESFPVELDEEKKGIARNEIQRLLYLLNIMNGAVNLDFIFDSSGKFYILEVAPRSGGNLITDAIKAGSGVDLAKYVVKTALGEDCSELKETKWHKFIASYIIHSAAHGIFEKLEISPTISKNIILKEMFVREGETVKPFDNASLGLGAMLIIFKNNEEMLAYMDSMNEYIAVTAPPPINS